MGFYQPAQIVIDARKHGVDVRPVDINYSMWDNKLEEKSGNYCALRLGFRQVKGLREEDINVLIIGRNKLNNLSRDQQKSQGNKILYTTINSLRDACVAESALEKLADADAFRSLGFDRRQALWEVSTRNDRPIALFAGHQSKDPQEESVSLPKMTTSEHVVHDYAATSLSLKAHPVSFVRDKLFQLHILSTNELTNIPDGALVKVSGLVLVRQRPGTAGGICFMTIEDETGYANLVIFENLFEKYRKEILQSRLIMVEGKLQREGEVIHVIVKSCYDFTKLLRRLTATNNEDLPLLTLSRGDEKTIPVHAQNKRSQVRETAEKKIFPDARNFR